MSRSSLHPLRAILGLIALLAAVAPHAMAQESDSDGDGMTDSFETSFGLQINSDDRYEDLDGDWLPNLAEFLNESDPTDAEDIPSNCRIVGSTAYPTLMDALVSDPAPPDGTVVLLPAGIHTLSEDGVTVAERLFIIGQGADTFATVIQAHESGDPENEGLIVMEEDLYVAGVAIVGRTAPGTGVRLMNEGHSAFVRCAFRGHLTAIQSGTSTVPCANEVDLIGCLVTAGGPSVSARCYGLKLHGDHQVLVNFSTISEVTKAATTDDGMAVWCDGSDFNIDVRNSVLWNNGSSEIWTSALSPGLNINQSYVRGSSASVGTETDLKMRQGFLLPTSPCIDLASSTDPRQLLDIRGEARVIGSGPDIGAHEYLLNGESVWEDDLDGDGVSDREELRTFGSLFYLADTDGDDTPDGQDISPTDGAVEALQITITNPTAPEE